jgi:EmrB/QacA subfamily drug resistance transporter
MTQTVTPATGAPLSDPLRWKSLALLCTAFFMVILDVAILGVALPSIQADLGFAGGDLQWVATAYSLTFGGLLLLGGRAGDLLGRRRVFVVGTVLFTAASAMCAVAWAPGVLIGARAVQGVGAAVLTPAALSVIIATFEEGPERNKALGIWGAVGAVGATFGLILGGVLTDVATWEWVFVINLPVGAAVLALTPRLVRESRIESGGRLDLAGAGSLTAGLALLVYGIVEAPDAGWDSTRTVSVLLASALLLATFGAVERRSPTPLVPLRVLRSRTLLGANAAAGLSFAGAYGLFFVSTLYAQQVLGYSPLEAGLAFLAMSFGGFVGSMGGQGLVTRTGSRPIGTVGMLAGVGGFALLTRVPVDGDYLTDLLPAFLLEGVAVGMSTIACSIAALSTLGEREAGLASGLLNTSQQIGGALGVAVLSTAAVSQGGPGVGVDPAQVAVALTAGFQDAYAVGVVLAVVGLLAALVLPGRTRSAGEALG